MMHVICMQHGTMLLLQAVLLLQLFQHKADKA
jgi:hypothetical protein